MMKIIRQIARVELSSLFYSPIAWLLLIIFIIQAAMAFMGMTSSYLNAQNAGNEGFRPATVHVFTFYYGALIVTVTGNLLLYIPLLTMGLISRELHSGSIKLLLSSPVRIGEIVFGKYLAMVAYCLMLALVLAGFMFVGGFTVESLDYGAVLSGILGVFLLACAYAAIGLFMSSLTSHQVVAALSTLAVLAGLKFIGTVGQTVPVLNKITYWLAMSGRVDVFRNGLISTKHVFYFVSIIGLFLGLTILKLSAGRKLEAAPVKIAKYGAVVLAAVLFGYVTSRPAITGYLDMTRVQSQSLTEASVGIIEQIESPWKITSYVNVLDSIAYAGLPRYRNFDYDRYEQYLRYNPDLTIEYVFYYDTSTNKRLYERYPELSDEELAKQYAEQRELDFEDFLTPAEMKEIIDLEPEKYRFIRRVEWNGQSALIRQYEDIQRFASEREKSAALKRLLVGPKKIAVITGHGERSAYKKGTADYKRILSEVTYRYAMISHGFDVTEVTLNAPLPGDIDLLVIADPKTAYTRNELRILDDYIDKGGNLLIAGEPGRQGILNPIVSKLGVRLLPGQVFQEQEEFPTDVIFAERGEEASRYAFEVPERAKLNPLILAGAAGLAYAEDGAMRGSIKVMPILVTDGEVAWHRRRVDSASVEEVTFDPARDSKATIPLALALTREVDGTEQRIMVVGDADFMSTAELSRLDTPTNNQDYVFDLFTWLSDGEYPIDTERMDFPDKRVLVDRTGILWLKVALYGAVPLFLFIGGAALLYRRRRN